MAEFEITKRTLLRGVAAGGAVAGLSLAPSAFAQSGNVPASQGNVDMDKALEPGPLPEIAMGEEDAPVKIIEYLSMTCPHCANYQENTFPAIKENYIDTGKVYYIFREFPFDPRAMAAFMLARCAPNGKYVPFMDMMLSQLRTWATAEDGSAAMLQMAKLAGFTQESFQACLTDQKLLDEINSVRERGAEEFGISATPTFLINGKKYSGDMSVDTMSALIDSML
ncbi:DsbA family protein [Martelella sp. AD-3]|uniref:DsbA family protein n=1 Tax=Martelella sp. AD-3 TaxID=686597 RepID=UPI000463E2A1|nr:DsbA family protein [Martelella sp. AD-3]AMM85435.1 disulfide bond formation protein DsbA [Martelella sp. AD-3]